MGYRVSHIFEWGDVVAGQCEARPWSRGFGFDFSVTVGGGGSCFCCWEGDIGRGCFVN